MLRSLNKILGYTIRATDGEIGSAHDFYFDDGEWIVRYLVVDTGGWLSGRRVLISSGEVGRADWKHRLLTVSLTREKVEHSPGVESDLPVSRQEEEVLGHYYDWVPYWGGACGIMGTPVATVPDARILAKGTEEDPSGDPHLRSIKEVTGYHILASDGEIGHVDDFIVDTEKWVLRYLLIDTRNWLPGRKVLVAPNWVGRVDWTDRLVNLDLNRQQVEDSPEFDPSLPLNREYEIRLYDYYGRPGYWY
jgi:hypothetical protein